MSTAKTEAPQPQSAADDHAEMLDRIVEATRARQRTITGRAAAFLGCQPEHVFDMLRVVWTVTKGEPPLTDQELKTGLALVARYELDPFAREIYVTRGKKGLMTILGIDAWIKILDRTPHYNGFEQELHEDGDGNLVWVETRIYSKIRDYPAIYRAYKREYAKLGGYVAGIIPDHMLRLFSLRHAARLFVPLGGVVTQEEAEFMQRDALPEDGGQVPPKSLNELGARLKSDKKDDTKVTAGDQDKLYQEFRQELEQAPTPGRVAALVAEIAYNEGKGMLTQSQANDLLDLAHE